MRPESYREQVPEKRCENCQHCHIIRSKDEHLCFHNDRIIVKQEIETMEVYLKGSDTPVSDMNGGRYQGLRSDRVVHPNNICDDWKGRLTIALY